MLSCLSSKYLIVVGLLSLSILLETRDTREAIRVPVSKARFTTRILSALNKVLGYYGRTYKRFDIDGIFGLRVLEGVLDKTIKEVQQGYVQEEGEMNERLKDLRHRASKTANASLPYLRTRNSQYYSELDFLVKHPWRYVQGFSDLPLEQRVPAPKESFQFAEDLMDLCFSSLTRRHSDGTKNQCNITDECWEMVSTQGLTGYFITHQILYFMVAELAGCHAELTKKFNFPNMHSKLTKKFNFPNMHSKLTKKFKLPDMHSELQLVYKGLCAAVHQQLIDREMRLTTSELNDNMDVYMEESVVCGFLGFRQFFSLDRLAIVLGWQQDNGCYGKITNVDLDHGVANNVLSERRLEHSRSKRKSVELEDGCSTHMTGVATGLLAINLRWLLTSSHAHFLQHHVMKRSTKFRKE